jgi:hypothetical protein
MLIDHEWSSLCWREWQCRPLRMLVTTTSVALATLALWSLLAFGAAIVRGDCDPRTDRWRAPSCVPKAAPMIAASLALHRAQWPCYLKEGVFSASARPHLVSLSAALG